MKTILIQQAYPDLGLAKMLELTNDRHSEYCKRHNIEFLTVTGYVIEHEAILGSYPKIKLIQNAMKDGFEHIVWLDADTIIYDIDAYLPDAIVKGKIGACWHRLPQLHHWNVGALYIDNTDNTRHFIDKWLASYPPPRDGWNEQGVFNRMGRGGDVVTVSDKWNATIDVSIVPDAVVLGYHGQPDRYEQMQDTMKILADKEALAQAKSEVHHA